MSMSIFDHTISGDPPIRMKGLRRILLPLKLNFRIHIMTRQKRKPSEPNATTSQAIRRMPAQPPDVTENSSAERTHTTTQKGKEKKIKEEAPTPSSEADPSSPPSGDAKIILPTAAYRILSPNLPKRLFTIDIYSTPGIRYLRAVDSNASSLPETAEEFKYSIDHLRYKNPWVQTWESRVQAEEIAKRVGGQVFEIDVRKLEGKRMIVRAYDDEGEEGEFLVGNMVPAEAITQGKAWLNTTKKDMKSCEVSLDGDHTPSTSPSEHLTLKAAYKQNKRNSTARAAKPPPQKTVKGKEEPSDSDDAMFVGPPEYPISEAASAKRQQNATRRVIKHPQQATGSKTDETPGARDAGTNTMTGKTTQQGRETAHHAFQRPRNRISEGEEDHALVASSDEETSDEMAGYFAASSSRKRYVRPPPPACSIRARRKKKNDS
ncbi:hypothetical protein B0O99DRAFT_146270 [Bisporella sp. PMI_857]|nr:hypothetical protein B0O99DRAFT_146270 [Bisporella sp. PMI_857]